MEALLLDAEHALVASAFDSEPLNNNSKPLANNKHKSNNTISSNAISSNAISSNAISSNGGTPVKLSRGHRAQSGVWKFLTRELNPHKSTRTTCMHCQQDVPHHRKSEKARAHLQRCDAFRSCVADGGVERPGWLDSEPPAKGRKRKNAAAAAATEAESIVAKKREKKSVNVATGSTAVNHSQKTTQTKKAKERAAAANAGALSMSQVHQLQQHQPFSIQDAIGIMPVPASAAAVAAIAPPAEALRSSPAYSFASAASHVSSVMIEQPLQVPPPSARQAVRFKGRLDPSMTATVTSSPITTLPSNTCHSTVSTSNPSSTTTNGTIITTTTKQPPVAKKPKKSQESSFLSASSIQSSSAASITATASSSAPAELLKIHVALAMFFYTSATPFARIESEHLQNAFRLSNPDVVLPSPSDLSGSLLDAAYADTQARVNSVLRAFEFNSIVTNGWSPSSSSNEAKSQQQQQVNYMVVNEQQAFLLETTTSHIGADQREEDADSLTRKMIGLMNRCGDTISGVVTDNTVVNQVMWSKLKAAFPHRFFHGCASHGLHLFVQDIFSPAVVEAPRSEAADRLQKYPDGYPFERLAQLTDNCRRIVTLFLQDKSVNAELSRRLREANVPMVYFPSKTDWRSLRAAFQSLLAAHKLLQAIASDRDFVTRDSRQLEMRARVQRDLLDPDFVLLLEKAVAILQPLDQFMGVFEGEKGAPCSEVFYVFAKALPDALVRIPGLSKSERTYLLFLNQTRFNFLYGDAHGIAYLLDPRYIGDGLNADVRKNIEDIIFELPTTTRTNIDTNGGTNAADMDDDDDRKLEIAQQLTEYVIDATREKNTKSFRYTLLLRNKKTALQYWLTDGQRWPLLQRVACKVLSLPSSTVAAQRQLADRTTISSEVSASLPSSAVVAKLAFVKANNSDSSSQNSLHVDGLGSEEERVVEMHSYRHFEDI